MASNERKNSARTIFVLLAARALVAICLVTFQQQIPTVFQSPTIYDKEYINELKKACNLIPHSETLTAIGSPQYTYSTVHKVKIPWVETEMSQCGTPILIRKLIDPLRTFR